MVFIGSRGVVKTRTRGKFHCPECDISRAYAHRRIRRFFVFLFVPVMPLAGDGEFVQCGFCRRAYKPSILESGEIGERHMHRLPDDELSGAAASTLLVWGADDD